MEYIGDYILLLKQEIGVIVNIILRVDININNIDI